MRAAAAWSFTDWWIYTKAYGLC